VVQIATSSSCCSWGTSLSRTTPRPRKTEALRVRITDEERSGLQQLASSIDTTPSKVLRRLLREALNGAPEYFADGLEELRAAHRELAAVGRNLNQLARAANAGQVVSSSEIASELTAVREEVRRVEEVYRAAVERIRRRGVADVGRARA